LAKIYGNPNCRNNKLINNYTTDAALEILSAKKNYLEDQGQLLEGFSNVADWTVTGATASANTTIYKEGTQSLQLVSSAVNTAMQADKTISWDLSDADNIGIWAYTPAKAGFANNLTMMISNDNFANYLQWTQPSTYYLKDGEWHFYVMNKSEIAVGGGTPNWDNTFTKLRITIKSTASATPTLILGGIYKNVKGIPRVLFMADDAHQSVYDVMYDYIVRQKGQCMTFNVATSVIGTQTNCTVDMLSEMYNTEKVDLANHTSLHVDLTTLTAKQQKDTILAGKKALDDWGFTRASDHLAYPFGGFNADTLNICRQYHIKTARVVGTMMPQYNPVDDLLKLRCIQIINTTTVDTVKSHIDAAMKYGQTVILLFHQFNNEDPSANQTTYNISRFKEIVDYCISVGIPFTTISRWYYGLQNSKIV
jgi:peptidoglycan/xylan/chitin deacetylase (PgdA/CDA1 family)